MRSIIILLVFLPVVHSGILTSDLKNYSKRPVQGTQQNDPREEAFSILLKKCNTCHATKKRTDIFTKENMEGFAPEIYEQVFIKKKMPKGTKVQLTENETRILEHWIATVLEVKNIPPKT